MYFFFSYFFKIKFKQFFLNKFIHFNESVVPSVTNIFYF